MDQPITPPFAVDPDTQVLARRVPFVVAIREPVALIVLGVLFVLDYSAGIGIGKTWPVLLIVAGLLHLLGRTRAARTPVAGELTGGPRP